MWVASAVGKSRTRNTAELYTILEITQVGRVGLRSTNLVERFDFVDCVGISSSIDQNEV